MKHLELDLEHHYKSKFIGRRRLRPSGKTLVIGQAVGSDIRLLGDDVSLIHAFIEYHDGSWSVLDAGSARGTWVSKRPVIQEPISEETVITIGSHHLKLKPKTTVLEIFSEKALQSAVEPAEQTEPTGQTEPAEARSHAATQIYHQVIVRKNKNVQDTYLLSDNKSFVFSNENKEYRLPPPKVGEIKNNQIGPYIITQRLARAQKIPFQFSDMIKGAYNPEMRTTLFAVLLCILVFGVLVLTIPHKPAENLTDLIPDNKYNRMIFDSALVKKKRAEAVEMRKTIRAAAPRAEPAPLQNTLSVLTKSKGAPPKIVSKLKLQGLTALLGKISKRANVNGPMIVGFGKTADHTDTGTSSVVTAMGSLQNLPTGKVGNGAEAYKVAAVGTLGKGGGNAGNSLRGLAGLSAEGIGTGTVGIIDQETEIEGGLDKEIIAQYIKNYLGEIRYCYERQLSAEPDLYGKVQVKFTIDGGGNVSEYRIGTTTLNSAMVEGCILRRLARWKFPKPKGGTNVLVTYPFMFKSTN